MPDHYYVQKIVNPFSCPYTACLTSSLFPQPSYISHQLSLTCPRGSVAHVTLPIVFYTKSILYQLADISGVDDEACQDIADGCNHR